MDDHTQVWDPVSLDVLVSLMESFDRPWWVAGGWAIDLFIGEQTRTHEDIDIIVDRQDQIGFQQFMQNWDLLASDPPGTLRKWEDKEFLKKGIHDVWCRRAHKSSWDLQLMLCDFEEGAWIYRRNTDIRGPKSEFGSRSASGIPFLNPEIQLLYKSRTIRLKDHADFEKCQSHLGSQRRKKLYEWIMSDSGPNHLWLPFLAD